MTEIRKLPPRRVDQPRSGFFLMRLVKAGPLVPVAIFESFGFWEAEIAGRRLPGADDPVRAEKVMAIWLTHREEIDRAEYERRLKLAQDPSHPSSKPREAIDLTTAPPLF